MGCSVLDVVKPRFTLASIDCALEDGQKTITLTTTKTLSFSNLVLIICNLPIILLTITVREQENLTLHKAILVVSAHWEEKTVTVQATAKPDLYFDYYGFPEGGYIYVYRHIIASAMSSMTTNTSTQRPKFLEV